MAIDKRNPHEILGKRYCPSTGVKVGRGVGRLAGVIPDFTVISYNTATDDCYVHIHPSGKEHLRLMDVLEFIKRGWLVESDRAPFVHARGECG